MATRRLRRLRPDEYTVGWVCALSTELAAAEEMLDEVHEDIGRDENDNNIYSLGVLGGHNIVIVCLPAGLIGSNPAAAVAQQMKARFRSVRFGLMVGVGGGVPSTADIRLGDVVVSQPHSGHGGVVQYDCGKTESTGFHRTGFLNCPDTLLLNAVSKVKAEHLRGKSTFLEHAMKVHRMPNFRRGDAGIDVLFKATYDHQPGLSCSQCSLTQREIRPQLGRNKPRVHYGTIASGNQVIKTGQIRDQVSKEFGGVLCFEMEAAGLMNILPCLVVRGICDYADSHKNKRWQPYAAGSAAAYAKELLLHIPATKISKENDSSTISIGYSLSRGRRGSEGHIASDCDRRDGNCYKCQ
ncbi:hypothetical protein ASPWEDRAFT_54236 [Aspergillus wentii DTO 134E9]|uniref:Nucleoside phosphorylase domain-containing protein n=1 Tax=Aspergillus wentii DTO 134E9 TaxID=1073089 RepID=A0A1L9R7M1_ASPWE|nr:uncharacterized protein ASPWEDRAFT_54236 [Aspergillus wentii DTO 134E9]OJJ30904.1 hypothetical protein ASPWEDRAFT_54236 [Aspergillus wentii DTO 134E9]